MFFRKITSRSNGKEYTYVKLIENYREGGKVKQRVVANLGSLENLTPDKIEGLISGLSRICGIPRDSVQLEAKKVLRYGEVLAIHKIWEILDISSAIRNVLGDQRNDLNIPLLVELMAMNQVIKPQNKQAISDWYRCLYLPELEGKELLPYHFYRALDSIAEFKEELEKEVFRRLAGFSAVDTGVVFCRLATGIIEPPPGNELNLSSYGKYFLEEPEEKTKVDFAILVSRDGMPFGHRMLKDITEESYYREIVNHLRNNYGAKRCIFVGDRNFASNPDLEVLVAHGYEYLLSRRVFSAGDRDLVRREVTPGKKNFLAYNEDLWFKEVAEGGVRYLLCYNPQAAEQKKTLLQERLEAIEAELKAIQKDVAGRREKGARMPFKKNASVFKDRYCLRYFEWNYNEATMEFTYQRKDDILRQEQELAGLSILETNSNALSGHELLEAYANLAQIGESFREIKSFEARPSKLKAELNISANIFVCVLAAAMERTLERIIRRAGLNLNSRQTLELLEDVKVAVNRLGGREVKSVTSIQKIQGEILQAVGIDNLQRTFV